jgi:UDP-3-O-[3-hydroxymyristoyl] glucosamine N-acyltransferase
MPSSRSPLRFIDATARLGRNVKVWHFAYIGKNARLGDNVMIGSLSHIDADVTIGANSRIEGCVYVPPLTVIGHSVFVGPGVVFTNDPYPASGRLAGTVVGDRAVIGGGALIRAGLRVGRDSVIGMGAVVTRDVPPGTVVLGLPARRVYSTTAYRLKQAMWRESGSRRADAGRKGFEAGS